MISYYIDLLGKPVYLLSQSEKMFIDIFPLLFLGAVSLVVYIVVIIIDIVNGKNKRK